MIYLIINATAPFLKSYYAPFSLYNLNTREHILTLSFYHKRYNDDKIKKS